MKTLKEFCIQENQRIIQSRNAARDIAKSITGAIEDIYYNAVFPINSFLIDLSDGMLSYQYYDDFSRYNSVDVKCFKVNEQVINFLEDEGWERGELHYMTFYII